MANIYNRKQEIGKSKRAGEFPPPPPAKEPPKKLIAEELCFYVMDAKSGSLLTVFAGKFDLVSPTTGEPYRAPSQDERYQVQQQLKKVAERAFPSPGEYNQEEGAEAIAIATSSTLTKGAQALYLIKFWNLLPLGVTVTNKRAQ
ncbi:hypothetical protein [Neolewinella litorea]|uniref:Uncharacterized protein n=1 Tax=Neolewinella litorea TaxID=2562452 RepID=A0A4S4N954_9BACT|nr:hypothetical protein [Neolewinella litorea]THH34531.1 hypothetical protein E4021_17685 [Neolewinella litorea]